MKIGKKVNELIDGHTARLISAGNVKKIAKIYRCLFPQAIEVTSYYNHCWGAFQTRVFQ